MSDQKNQIELREKEELEKWKVQKNAPLTLEVALKMYELYLNGYTCEEIYRVNGGKYSFGQIIDAKLKHKWDERKKARLDDAYSNIEERVLKTKNDALKHITDMMAASMKLMGDKVSLYLQEGDPALLEGTDLGSIKTYKDLLQMLQALAPEKKIDRREVNVKHILVAPEPKKLTGEEAGDLLKLIEGETVSGQ